MSPTLRMRAKDNAKLSARFRSMARQLPVVVDEALREAATDMQDDYELTAATWDHAVAFSVEQIDNGYTVVTDDEIWNMLEGGTRAHRIEPVNGDVLAFNAQYNAKTRVGSIQSVSGGPSGDMIVIRSGVDHPGTAPRKWHRLIYEKWKNKAVTYVRNALKRGVEAIGL